jgi:RHS repeat-associated protein
MLASVTYSNLLPGEDTPGLAYTYDDFGRLRTVTQGSGVTQNSWTYAYNDDDAGGGGTLGAGLGLYSETVSYDNGTLVRTLRRHEDSLLRPAGWQVLDGTTPEHAASYGYDSAGRLAHVHPAWPLPATPADADFDYSYVGNSYGLIGTVGGPAHNVTNLWEANRVVLDRKDNTKAAGGGLVSRYDYTVNAIGQREAVSTSGTAFGAATADWDWGYNDRGELVEAEDLGTTTNHRAYQYDAIGNREKTVDGLLADLPAAPVNYDANDLNQYIKANGVTLPVPAHDADGNYISGPLPEDAGTATLTWNAENRLVKVEKSNGDVVTCEYDYLGRRITRTVTPSGGSATTTRYLYDGWNVLTQYAGTSLNRSFTWGLDLSGSMQGAGGVGGLLAVRIDDVSGAPSYYPAYDGNGNVCQYLDSGGSDYIHVEYDPFGNLTRDKHNTADDAPYLFSSKPRDLETGLYYYGFRQYDPMLGRWPSRDPIGEGGEPNLYGFIGNESIAFVDAVGLIRRPPRQGDQKSVFSISCSCAMILHTWCIPDITKFKDHDLLGAGVRSFNLDADPDPMVRDRMRRAFGDAWRGAQDDARAQIQEQAEAITKALPPNWTARPGPTDCDCYLFKFTKQRVDEAWHTVALDELGLVENIDDWLPPTFPPNRDKL